MDNIEEDLTQIKVENGKRMQKVYTINISYDQSTGRVSNINFTPAGEKEI